MVSNLLAYMMYLRNLTALDIYGKVLTWDRPCPRFKKSAEEAIRRGWARRRWIFFGPIGLTKAGHLALMQMRVP